MLSNLSPSDDQFTSRHELHDFLPIEDGVFTRRKLFVQFGVTGWEDRIAVTIFCGSRNGNDPRYKFEAEEFSRLTATRGIGLVNGGAPPERLGLMSAATDHNPNLIAISPAAFADKNGFNTGISARAINFITYDFYVRKPLMGLMADAAAVLPGGYGTLEEALEYLIYADKTGKSLCWSNSDGFWNPYFAQHQRLTELGLTRRSPGSSHTTIQDLVDSLEHKIRGPARSPKATPKHGASLQSFLRENPTFISNEVFGFIGEKRPRIGVIVSSNISPDRSKSHLKDQRLVKQFCEQSVYLGRRIARKKAVLVLAGDKDGLREIMADTAVKEGGIVIWVLKDNKQTEPLRVHFPRGRRGEMIFSVKYEFEKAMLFDLISQATGFLPGGIHTMDRVFEVVTRQQTGFGGISAYPFLMEDISSLPHRPACPTAGLNLGGIWNDIYNQCEVFNNKGFMGNNDLRLFQMVGRKEIVDVLIENARTVTAPYDLLQVIRQRQLRSGRPFFSFNHG